MVRFAASLSRDPDPRVAVGNASAELLEAFDGDQPDLVVWFASPHFVPASEDVTEVLQSVFDPAALIGTTAVSIVGGAHEVE